MAEKKYEKYVVSELNVPQWRIDYGERFPGGGTMLGWLSNDVVEGAFHVETLLFLPGENTIKNQAHTHDCDEVVGFFGFDTSGERKLNGEVEFWLEDESYVFTKSTMLFVPRGMQHCPMIIRRVDIPIFHFTIMPNGEYAREFV